MTRSTYALSQVVNLIGGGTPKRSETAFWNGDIPWLSVKNFNNDSRYVENAEEYITQLGLKKSSTKILDPGMLIISARGTVGELAQLKSQMAFNQSCYGIDANSEYLENDYLYYLLKIKIRELKSIAHGSVFDTITRETFDNIFVSIPPKKEQLAIVEILGALDAKIELNQKMNETLEEIAKTLFKSWFIDFDPVRAKAEGRPTGLSKEISDLFPDSFEDSELGEIPKDWKLSSLDDKYDFLSGYAFKSKDWIETGVPVVKIKSIDSGRVDLNTDTFVSEEFLNTKSSYILDKGDLLIAMTGATIGKVGVVPISTEKALLNQRVGKFVHRDNTKNLFLNCFASSKYFLKNIENLASGSARDNISKDQILSIKTVIPTDDVYNKFGEVTEDIRKKILIANNENQILEKLRDTLLPKLISGELKIPNAENLIEEAEI